MTNLLIGDDQLNDGHGVEDGDRDEVPDVQLRLLGQDARVLTGQVGHKQERLGSAGQVRSG